MSFLLLCVWVFVIGYKKAIFNNFFFQIERQIKIITRTNPESSSAKSTLCESGNIFDSML